MAVANLDYIEKHCPKKEKVLKKKEKNLEEEIYLKVD